MAAGWLDDGMGTMGDDSHPAIGCNRMVYNGVGSIVETEHAMTRRLQGLQRPNF